MIDAVLGDLTVFHSYACRVKHISHYQDICIDPFALSRLISKTLEPSLLPNLVSAQISSTGCHFIRPSLSLSRCLQKIDLDLGFKSTPVEKTPPCDYLERIARVARGIEVVNVRGLMCERLNLCISSMKGLRVLSLRTGASLTAETLAALAHFPFLAELDVHGGHIHADSFICAMEPLDNKQFFTSLKKLHVRANSPLVNALLRLLHPGTLKTLRIEAQDHVSSPVSWSTIFALIRSKTFQSLQDLFIEHHIDIEDIDNTPGTPNASLQTQHHSQFYSSQIIFHTLRPLSDLRSLRRCTLDMALPPDFCDADMVHIAQWWPDLEHLDFGTLPVVDHFGTGWQPRPTFACLEAFAMYALNLRSLILPLDISAVDASTSSVSGSCVNLLRRLTVGSTVAPNLSSIARRLRCLFPALEEIDGTGKHVHEWDEVQKALNALPRL
jgi:hypothetical protein